MSINSSSKPHSVANNLVNTEKLYSLVFKSGTQGKRLTQDAIYVCQLLAINPDDLIQRDFESFTEKGLSEKRQLLRYEHYEEKRQLKLRAIQNVLIKCMSKETNNGEIMQVQALLEGLKKQSQTSKNQQFSPLKSRMKADQQQSMFMASGGAGSLSFNAGTSTDLFNMNGGYGGGDSQLKSAFLLENNTVAARQMERALGKLQKWSKIRETVIQKKQEHDQRLQQLLAKEKKKFDKISKNQQEQQENRKQIIEYHQSKWQSKVQSKKSEDEKLEKQNLARAREILSETEEFFQSKMKKERSLCERVSRPDLMHNFSSASPGIGGTGGINSTSFASPKGQLSFLRNTSTSKHRGGANEDDKTTQLELEKLELKLKRAEERANQVKESIVSRQHNHSEVVSKRKQDYEQQQKLAFESFLDKTVRKAMKTKSKQESRIKEISQAAEKLQEIHRQKEEKMRRQQEEERRNLMEQLRYQSEKMNRTEMKILEKKQQFMEQISGKKEKRKLQFEDKAENERRLKLLQMNMKQQIYEKHLEKEKKINEMKKIWLNNSVEDLRNEDSALL